MRQRIFLAILGICALLFILFIGCSDDSSNPLEADLTGAVHAQGGTTVLVGVTVSAQGQTTMTDANGQFALHHLQPGQTVVTLVKQGFISATVTVNLNPGPNTFSIAIEPAS